MTVEQLLNSCGNVGLSTRVFIEDREGSIYHNSSELSVPLYALSFKVRYFKCSCTDDSIEILIEK